MSKKPCSCIEGIFDLSVIAPSKDVMLIHDFSDWINDGELEYPNFIEIEVKKDGASFSVSFDPSIGAAHKVDISDGVYIFSINNCGVVYSLKELLTPNIQCAIDRALVANNEKDKEHLKNIIESLEMAKASAKIGDFKTSEGLIEDIKNKLTNISCDCKC